MLEDQYAASLMLNSVILCGGGQGVGQRWSEMETKMNDKKTFDPPHRLQC